MAIDRGLLSAESLMKPKVALALRVSGQLLLGLARIYSRKVTFLFADCSDALSKIQSVSYCGCGAALGPQGAAHCGDWLNQHVAAVLKPCLGSCALHPSLFDTAGLSGCRLGPPKGQGHWGQRHQPCAWRCRPRRVCPP